MQRNHTLTDVDHLGLHGNRSQCELQKTVSDRCE